ncbi:hypothetical protein ACGFIF_41245 [Kribbella sp. NPDC049174]|uniref:hypothetical protein n=1 Tax=Kribbella sp. NPDC049174 TaxID=3364112 RepID=UPI003712E088
MKSPSVRRPVFLDSTGRRHRAIRRGGALLAVPVVGYLILLVSSLLGGPSLDTPLVPLPEAGKPAVEKPLVPPGPAAVQSERPSESAVTPDRATEPTSTPTSSSTPVPSSTPTVVPTPTIAPTTPVTGSPTTPPGKPTTAHASNKPTVPPGRTKSPSRP